MLFYLYGGLLIANGEMLPGTLVAFVAAYDWIVPALDGYIDLHIDFRRKKSSIVRVFGVFADAVTAGDSVADVSGGWKTAPGGIENATLSEFASCKPQGMVPADASIAVEHLSYRYGTKMVLNDVSLQIKSGEFLGICGKSGSGKSTLANLMAGLLDGYDGEVFVGREDIRKVPRDWTTKNLIYLGQDGYLMNLSIRDNILFYSQSHTDEDLEKVLRLVKLEEWIKKLPEGLDTVVGERANAVSGGERQRILLARALLRNPKIFIFDESTSALDVNTEKEVMDNIRKFYPDADFSDFDMIIGMDDQNIRDLQRMATSEEEKNKIFKMTDFCQRFSYRDSVPDPYYGGDSGFELVLDLLEDAVEGLLDQLGNK